VRARLLDLLDVPPEPELWASEDNILKETHRHLAKAEWFEVYNFIEVLARALLKMSHHENAALFERKINHVFERTGIGWKLNAGTIEARGSEGFESVVRQATTALRTTGLAAAEKELHEALSDLSRRPSADLTGAIQHSAAALECVAREASGDTRATLGQILSRFPNMLPAPLPEAMTKVWGYASETARHVREGANPSQGEAELVVGLTAAIVNFLVQEIARRKSAG
jgi:hypothetical protein